MLDVSAFVNCIQNSGYYEIEHPLYGYYLNKGGFTAWELPSMHLNQSTMSLLCLFVVLRYYNPFSCKNLVCQVGSFRAQYVLQVG